MPVSPHTARRKRPGPSPRALRDYAEKRAFAATPEPAPRAVRARTGPLVFVVQQHAARRLHYDFRLEADGVLKSWAVPKGPSLDPAHKRLAVQTEDHPFEYASFEGVIPPKQYGAGQVIVWDCGVYTPDDDDTHHYDDRALAERRVREGIEKGKLSFTLRGIKLNGSFALVRASDRKSWFLIKRRDRFATTDDVLARARSVLSDLDVSAIKAAPTPVRLSAADLAPSGPVEPLPTKLKPMLAEPGDAPFTHPDWLFEPKLDGYRVLAFIDGDRVVLRSRRGLDLTRAFPAIGAELAAQEAGTMVLDGEVVALDADGRPSFSALQKRVQLKTEREVAAADATTPAIFFCFDLLHFAGIGLREAPYSARRRYLAQCLFPSPHVQLVHAQADGDGLHAAALANGFEGVMAKKRASLYTPGRRSASWRKIKSTQSAEFIVGGYTRGKGARASLGALMLGVNEPRVKGKLRYVGHVGTGFDASTLTAVRRRAAPLETAKSPFATRPAANGAPTWLAPRLVAEVKFAEWTPDGHLRAPVFLRFRDDVDPKAVTGRAVRRATRANPSSDAQSDIDAVLRQLDEPRDTLQLVIGAARVKLTHLNRVYWPAQRKLRQPALTKRDLLRYLTRVSPFMLPHLADRPLTMIRFPEGIEGERFFQKHWSGTRPDFVRTVTVFSASNDERQDYLVCNDLATLLWVAQAGTLEFHVWHSRTRPGPDAAQRGTDFSTPAALKDSVLNHPDYVVFDIDPYIYSGKEAAGAEPELNTTAFEKGREVAFWLRELLQEMRLEPIVKTSGKTGLHVFVPIAQTIDFAVAREVSERVGRHLLRAHPRDITMEWSVKKRTGKIFMDYSMNVRGKTLNAAYSPRALPGAPVSMPVTWKELEHAHPLDFRLMDAPERLARTGDRWKSALTDKQDLAQALKVQRGTGH